MSKQTKHEGDIGESFAVTYLEKTGYQIIHRNFRTRNGEIDIVAIDKMTYPHTLCFIEVKTRTSYDFGTPFDAIGYGKLIVLRRTAEVYKHTHRNLPDLMRLDAVSVMITADYQLASIELVKNIG